MGDSCISVSLSLVGSIVYLPRTRVESCVPILGGRAKNLYYCCHYQVEAGNHSQCSHRASIRMHEVDFIHLCSSGITFCGQAFSLLGLHACWSIAGGGRSRLGTLRNWYGCNARAYMRSRNNKYLGIFCQ